MLSFNHFIYFFISVFSLMVFSIYARKINLLDKPNYRSSHFIPTPKSSGIILCLLNTIFLLLNTDINTLLILSISSLCFLGFLDDIFDIKPKIKLIFQFFCICLIYYFSNNLGLMNFFNNEIYNFIFFSFLIIYFINIFNFMDGIDGISSVSGIFCLLSILFTPLFIDIKIKLSNEILILISLLFSHLILNFTKFKTFLGDSGSLYISCLLIIYLLLTFSQSLLFLNIFLILFSYYIFDTTATLLFRLKNKKDLFKSHKDHIYQRLNIYFKSHLRVNLIIISYNIFVVAPILVYYINNIDNFYIILLPYFILIILHTLFYDFIRKIN